MLSKMTVKGASWMVFSRFVGKIIDFVALLVLARILTPSDFGTAALAMSFILVIEVVFEVPVSQALVRLKTIDKHHLDTAFTLGVLRSLAIALLVLALAWPMAKFYNEPQVSILFLTLAIGSVARGFVSPAMVKFNRQLSFRETFLVELTGKVCGVSLAVATAIAGGGYWAIISNFVVSACAATFASHVLAPYRPSLSLARWSDFSSFVGWFSSAQIVAAVNWQYDRVLLGRFVNTTSLGRYALASDIAVLPTQSVIGPAMHAVFAAFSKIQEPDRRRNAFLRAARFVMLISLPVCVGISLTADLSVPILLGPNWKEAAPLLTVLALTALFVPYFQCLYAYSLSIDRPDVIFKLNTIDLVLKLAFITAGAYFYAVDGAVSARVGISIVMFLFYLMYSTRGVGVGLVEQVVNLWKVAFAGAALTISVLAFRRAISGYDISPILELAATAAFGALIYGIAVYLTDIRGASQSNELHRWLRGNV